MRKAFAYYFIFMLLSDIAGLNLNRKLLGCSVERSPLCYGVIVVLAHDWHRHSYLCIYNDLIGLYLFSTLYSIFVVFEVVIIIESTRVLSVSMDVSAMLTIVSVLIFPWFFHFFHLYVINIGLTIYLIMSPNLHLVSCDAKYIVWSFHEPVNRRFVKYYVHVPKLTATVIVPS